MRRRPPRSSNIYFPDVVAWARAYAQPGNPLFVPETGRNPEATPANALYAIGALDADPSAAPRPA